MSRKDFRNILIFNPFGIGDVIFSTPLIKALKSAYPEASISYVCNRRVFPVLKNNPLLSRVIVYEKDEFRSLVSRSKIVFLRSMWRFLMDIKSIRTDLFVDLSLNYKAGFWARVLGMPVRIGFNYRGRGGFLTGKVELDGFEKKHVILYYLDLLSLLGIKAKDIFPEAHSSAESDLWAGSFLRERGLMDKRLVAIVPGGGFSWGNDARYRRWPVANFAHVADKVVSEYGDSVIIFGDKKEEKLCSSMLELMNKEAINMGGLTSMEEFMALVKRCDFVICNEGGPLHIAVALGVPTVSLFGPVDEAVYGPLSDSPDLHRVVTDRTDCRPCYSKFKHKKCQLLSCLNKVTVEAVFGAASQVRDKIITKRAPHA